MHRLIRRSPLPVGLAVAVAAAPAGGGVAPPADAAGDRAAAPASDLAVPAPVAMQWATPGARRPRTIALHRRAAARRAGLRVVRTRARAVVRAARSQIGDAYAYGAGGPGAFDCSGLTAWAMRRAGVSLPHSSFAQAETGRSVSRGDIRAGDLVFFSTAGPGASHVGIATSRDTVVSATSHGVMAHSISDSYWGGAYDGARRVVTRRH
jgi:cell wall-associated NlpC family hydrolase